MNYIKYLLIIICLSSCTSDKKLSNVEKDFLKYVKNDNIQEVKKLLPKVDINCKDVNDWTALHYASSVNMCKLLLENSANPNITEDLSNLTPLMLVSGKGDIGSAKLLLKHGANINTKSPDGTALSIAVFKQRAGIVSMLLNNNANPNISSDNNNFPIIYACIVGNLQFVKDLIKKGANVNTKSPQFGSPLHVAASRGFQEIIEYLIKNNADMNSQGKDDKSTPLICAIEKPDMMKILLDNNADINLTNKDGKSALIETVCLNRPDSVLKSITVLLDHKADVNLKDRFGFTALNYAKQRKNKEVQNLLRKHGAKTAKELQAEENNSPPTPQR